MRVEITLARFHPNLYSVSVSTQGNFTTTLLRSYLVSRRFGMEVYQCLKTRLTIRSFRPDPVPGEVITRILEAGRWAPSSRNRQPWHFIVITNRDTLQQIGSIATSGSFIGQAPMAIAILMQGAERPDLDAGRALQQMEMLAWSEGLGTCFVGLTNGDQNQQVKELLDIPEDVDLITVLPFGYRLSTVKGRGRSRKPLSEIAHSGRFGIEYSGD